jgi:hypothetical protein
VVLRDLTTREQHEVALQDVVDTVRRALA